MSSVSSELYCGHCGGAFDGGDIPTSDAPAGAAGHQSCRGRLSLEPPRYCAQCRRRMKVQVTPLGWSAECSRHGTLTQA